MQHEQMRLMWHLNDREKQPNRQISLQTPLLCFFYFASFHLLWISRFFISACSFTTLFEKKNEQTINTTEPHEKLHIQFSIMCLCVRVHANKSLKYSHTRIKELRIAIETK